MTIRQFTTRSGHQIVRIPVEVFPNFWATIYVVQAGEYRVLIDIGSGFNTANEQVLAGLDAASAALGQPMGLPDLTHILITHGHIDHYGGLTQLRPQTSAQVGVHELDLRILTNYEERTAIVTHRLSGYLVECGLAPARHSELMNLYSVNKSLYQSSEVDFTFEAAGMQLGPFEFLHVPGHCSGQVVIKLDEVLFAGDFVLSRTTPHMAPESLSLNTGLTHYLESLDRIRPWVTDVELTLPGHEDEIRDLDERIDAIKAHHVDRLQKTLDLLAEPGTVSEVSDGLFGDPQGYNALLAIEEAGAHVEYLYTRGQLGISNLEDAQDRSDPVPLKYVRL
jgi:glyoxylase-like metal-dependent hydrolase (beta-lactamase superfamily II)